MAGFSMADLLADQPIDPVDDVVGVDLCFWLPVHRQVNSWPCAEKSLCQIVASLSFSDSTI